MIRLPNKMEKELIRKIQRGFAYVRVETGEVYSVFDDWTCTGDEYLGRIRRRFIPNRRLIVKALEEMTPERRLEREKHYERINSPTPFWFYISNSGCAMGGSI